MSRVLCLLERSAGGNTLTGLRLYDGREVRTHALAAEGEGAGAGGGDAGLVRAAQWIAQQLGPHGPEGVLTLCLDADGGRCQWLSAPSAQVRVVEASVREMAFVGGDDGGERYGVWAAAHGEAGMDLSVQPLLEPGGAVKKGTGSAEGEGGAAAVGARQRLAVLAVPDLPARLLIDELDRLGVVVHECISVWHALASAWDPARAKALAAGTLVREDEGAVEAGALAGAGPVSATVAVEGRGRLLWAWSREGVLLAAGSMRLRAVQQGEANVVEVSRSEVGRVLSEWLAWGVQLGVAPSRIGVIGPDTVTCAGLEHDLPEMPGVGAVASAIGSHWAGAAVAAHVEADPVASALARLAGVQEAGVREGGGVAVVEPPGLAALSARPVRATRHMYAWSAAAVGALALLLGATAWKVDGARARLELRGEELAAERKAALGKIKPLVPQAETALEPIKAIRDEIANMERTHASMTPERPVLAALAQIAAAVSAVPGAKFREKERLSITGVGGITARFGVPDAQTGANLLIALRENLGPPRIDWQGTPGGTAENRTYNISGSWVDAKPGARHAGGGGAP